MGRLFHSVHIRAIGVLLVAVAVLMLTTAPAQARDVVWATGHVQGIGWQDTSFDGVGTTGQSLRLEAVQFTDPSIVARAHVQGIGWMAESTDMVGTTGLSLRLEALELHARWDGWQVWCQAHVQGIGWMEPVTDGQTCGSTGQSLRLEAVRIWMEPTL